MSPASRVDGIRSVGYATEIEVLPTDAVVERHNGFVVVRTPSNPDHYWGNFLYFDAPPGRGDRARWEQLFDVHVAAHQPARHRAFAWDSIVGALGAARPQFESAGYQLEPCVTLQAQPRDLIEPAAARRAAAAGVQVIALDPAPGAHARLWDGAVEVQSADPPPGHAHAHYRAFCQQRTSDRRRRFVDGDGAWYVAVLDGAVVAGCGVVVTAGRARFQAVDTVPAARRRGVASMLVHAAALDAVERHGARTLVIVTETGSHAQRLYESVGFRVSEHTCGVCWWPSAPGADRHPGR